MTCKDIHEQITAFVDDRIDEAEYREKVQQHLSYCPDCRAVYEMELLTKLAVKHHTPRVPTPEALRLSIAGDIEVLERARLAEIESRRRVGPEPDWLDRFAHHYLSPAGIGIALLLVALGSGFLLDPFAADSGEIVGTGPTPGSSSPPATLDASGTRGAVNLFNQVAENFQAIESHQLAAQFKTDDPERLAAFFRENGVSYPVRFAPVTLPLVGGVVSTHGSIHLAHLIYLAGDTIVYIFEVPVELLDRRDIVYVSDDVLKRLRQGEHIWDAPAPGESTLIVRQEAVVMAVVANLDRTTFERVVPIQ